MKNYTRLRRVLASKRLYWLRALCLNFLFCPPKNMDWSCCLESDGGWSILWIKLELNLVNSEQRKEINDKINEVRWVRQPEYDYNPLEQRIYDLKKTNKLLIQEITLRSHNTTHRAFLSFPDPNKCQKMKNESKLARPQRNAAHEYNFPLLLFIKTIGLCLISIESSWLSKVKENDGSAGAESRA